MHMIDREVPNSLAHREAKRGLARAQINHRLSLCADRAGRHFPVSRSRLPGEVSREHIDYCLLSLCAERGRSAPPSKPVGTSRYAAHDFPVASASIYREEFSEMISQSDG